ncbi:MAG: LarC family nickel insertion protein, partial [Candidatus Eremiobacteraeota bacterium]|nr:LarC family nickel insertion protein [Candidatus Eremiobacteraeota bacterium]
MNVAYFEMIGGASGNMLLGSLIDAGAELAAIESALRTIPVEGWTIECRRVVKQQLAATYFDFVIPGEDHHPADHTTAPRHGRHLADVLAILDRSGLAATQKERARAVYVRLAEAEAKMHGTTVENIHFHEVGATDAILDVAGTIVALDALGVERVACGPFPVGRGTIDMEHGRYPNPPPTTAELLRDAPTFDGGIDGEMVTPTGAAILTSLVAQPGVRPAMTAQRIGYGAGRSNFAIPNVTRVSIGSSDTALQPVTDTVAILEPNID